MGRHKFVTLSDVFEAAKKEFASELHDQNETIWTVEEVARQLGYGEKHIHNLISLQKIPFHRPLGKPIFLKGEIIRWIKEEGIILNKSVPVDVKGNEAA